MFCCLLHTHTYYSSSETNSTYLCYVWFALVFWHVDNVRCFVLADMLSLLFSTFLVLCMIKVA